ncbi:MAG: PH domain-containing protein [Euryarchaeota archaeon]|nr:PH domain-containing protein [Euryarchaeota archaeon]
MDTTEIYSSGILTKNEELLDAKSGSMWSKGIGVLVITNKRILFLKKPGMFSKGFHLLFEGSLGSIVSVTTTGLISKMLNVQMRTVQPEFEILQFNVGSKEETEITRQKLIGAKDEYKEKETISAKTVIIEQVETKEKADEILKKRLARGEITKEEFHDKIQRT